MIKLASKKNIMKEHILIFGTGAGGQHAHKVFNGTHKIIGFLDNNVNKHGTLFQSLPIFAPKSLQNLNFDRIIIASDYYKEINLQLSQELGVSQDKINIFHSYIYETSKLSTKLKLFFQQLSNEIICSGPAIIASTLFFLSRTNKNHSLKKITWLDTIKDEVIVEFIGRKNFTATSPLFRHKESSTRIVEHPAVCAYHFKNGNISTNSNSINVSDSIIMSRVPSANMNVSDYRADHISFHGKKRALLKKEAPKLIKKGIALTGSNDTNYYHWLLEVLSKLQYLHQLPSEYSNYPILISEQAEKIEAIKTFVSHTARSKELIFLKSTHCYQVEDLIYISSPNYLVPNLKGNSPFSVSDNYTRIESINYLRKIGYEIYNKQQNTPSYKRIFLARKPFIRQYNQSNVESLLKRYGFISVYLEDYCFSDQISIMANAEYIVGPTGAAWTNLIFAAKNTKALCWMAQEYGDLTCFSTIAEQLNINMQFITYSNNAHSTRETYYLPYFVSEKAITLWLNEHCPITD